MTTIKHALYTTSVFASVFALIVLSWAAVGFAVGVAVRAYRFVVG